jgi:hypothetical protein
MAKQHYDESKEIAASPVELFALIDDHTRLSSHMSKSSWMMGGGRMEMSLDEGRGQKVGSHIKLSGKAFGIDIFLDEVVVVHEPPRRKVWETVGEPRLLIIGKYAMAVDVAPLTNGSLLRVRIDYELPQTPLGLLFGAAYARWCVRRMINDAAGHFAASARSKAAA